MASSPSAPPRTPGNVHPPAVAEFQPKEKIKAPGVKSAKAYGTLNDGSSYSEYAWEFLKRNRFYQAMVDKRTPAFDLAQWGYRPTPAHEVGFGLKHVKPYTESHADAIPDWAPIAAWTERLQHTIDHFKNHQPQIEYPGEQVAVVFDLAPICGPGTIALQTQAALAVKFLERLVNERAHISTKVKAPAPARPASESSTEPLAEPKNRPSKRLLRSYLMIADLLTSTKPALDETLPVARQNTKPKMPTMEEVAKLLPHYDENNGKAEKLTDAQRLTRAYDYAGAAWGLIYGWECLNLLKFEDWGPPCPKSPRLKSNGMER